MPKSPEQFQAQRDERRERIKAEAMALFAHEGFAQVSVSRIAAAVGMSKGLLYSYFASKDDLVKEIVMDSVRKLMAVYELRDSRGRLDDEAMRFVLGKSMELLRASPENWRLYMAMVLQPQVLALVMPELAPIAAPLMAELVGFFAERGAPKPAVEARLLSAMVDGISLNYILDPENFPLDESIDRVLELYGLKA